MNNHEFEQQNTWDWNNILESIFNGTIPSEYIWTDTNEIISVLNKIGAVHSASRLFFPEYGSDEIVGASFSHEKGCIELDIVIPYVIRVKSLSFFSVNHDLDWNYFRLENENLLPSGACSTVSAHPCFDHLIELSPSVYIDGNNWNEMDFGHNGLPGKARILSRILNGDLVIFNKSAAYNQIDGAIEGMHATMSSAEFKDYFTGMYHAFH